MAKTGRHAPAFILLMLAEGPKHGLGILNAMDEKVPGHRLDTAVIYRVLKQLEGEGQVVASWASSDVGPKKKIYDITPKGVAHLSQFKVDIELRIQRLKRFISLYDHLHLDDF